MVEVKSCYPFTITAIAFIAPSRCSPFKLEPDGQAEMVTPRGRLTWARTRYTIVALATLHLLFINFVFFGPPLETFNPFPSSTNGQVVSAHSYKRPYEPASSLDEQPESLPSPIKQFALPPPSRKPVATYSQSDSSPDLLSLKGYQFDGEYVGWPLQRVCEEAQWTPGLAFVCDNNSGGIGNIRNFILTCIRYAIDAGATQLIMPRIQKRSAESLGKLLTTTFQPFNYFFDEAHFRKAMHTYCPQMKIFDIVDDIPNAAQALKIDKFFPKDLNIDLDGYDGRGVNRHLDMYHTKFHEWLSTRRRTPTAAEPVTIRTKWPTFFEWPVYRDGPEFAATFGDLLRFRTDVQELAAKVLSEMVQFTGTEPQSQTLDAPYLGVHLRTESDALSIWPNFKLQSTGYLEQAQQRGLQYAYLACGDEGEAKRFSDLALNQAKPLRVATKMTLLEGDDLKQLTDLSWDQQALVDFLVLTKSTHFTGCSFSSFAMNIALKRHLLEDGLKTRQWKSPGDEFSTLVGRFESWFGDWMFMYECMWP